MSSFLTFTGAGAGATLGAAGCYTLGFIANPIVTSTVIGGCAVVGGVAGKKAGKSMENIIFKTTTAYQQFMDTMTMTHLTMRQVNATTKKAYHAILFTGTATVGFGWMYS